jgi:K+-sensing histidine kinase KdpD
MENLLLLLPNRAQSILVTYGVTTLIVLVCFALQIGVEFQSGMFTFFLLLPGIFFVSILFDRGSGFYATLLSTALCIAALLPSDSWLLPPQYLLPFVLFVLVGLALATTGEAMRKALEKAVAAERSAEVLLYELNHRIRAVSIGLIVNVLVTNAFKYAFPDDRGGIVNVILHRASDDKLELVVEDNGKGCPNDAQEGLGSRIVCLLVQQLGSTITRASANPGCRVSLAIPDR